MRFRKLLRGGSWANLHGDARAACRGFTHPDFRSTDLGLRIMEVK